MERIVRFESSRRYYVARLAQDLLGDWTLSIVWGGLFNRLGGGTQEIVDSYGAGLMRLDQIERKRSSRHYLLIEDKTLF